MKLSEIIRDLEIIQSKGTGDPDITGIALDSRKVRPGYLFVAISGFKQDGTVYADQAESNGAAAVLSETEWNGKNAVWFQVPNARSALAVCSKKFNGSPDEALDLFGITGTNGKTTTAFLLSSILNHKKRTASLLGTIEHDIMGRVETASNTTPEACDLFGYFHETREKGGRSVVMEVSSHAIALQRVYGTRFAVCVFTNLTHDHLDFHKDVEDYFQAKARLFTENLKPEGTAVVNMDDPYGLKLAEILKKERPDVRMITYGFSEEARVRPLKHEMAWDGIRLELETPWGKSELTSSLSGLFNISNIMAAYAAAAAGGVPPARIEESVRGFRNVPGRFEKVEAGQPFTVLVDYAHTPDALERLLENARKLTDRKLITVFGCGGDRDRKKRPVMGKIAAEASDTVFVTSDNPRTEDPDAIIRDIMNGISASPSIQIVPDRKEAIRQSLLSAENGDCVVIAGKGHEDYQILGTEKHHFDDRETVREIITAPAGQNLTKEKI